MRRSTPATRDHVAADALLCEVGAQLRHARQQRGEELEDVAQHLRIRPAYLSGIEQGDLSGLPGRTYALGFLRTYADYLGFDGADLVARIKSSVGEMSDRTRLRLRAPMPENRLPRRPLVVVSLAVVAGIYLGWSYVNRTSQTAIDTVAEVPPDLREAAADRLPEAIDHLSPATGTQAASQAAPSDVAAAAAPPLGTATADQKRTAHAGPVADVGLADATPDMSTLESSAERDALTVDPAAGGGRDAPAPVAMPATGTRSGAAPPEADAAPGSIEGQSEAAAAVTAAAPDRPDPADPAREAVALLLGSGSGAREGEAAAQVFERANTDARVILRAREQAWIEISSPSRDYSFTRTLEPGDALLVPNRPDLTLWTGNARGLEIIVDGVPVSLPGTRLVRRNISLDPERLLASSAPSR